MTQAISVYFIPLILSLTAAFMLKKKHNYFDDFLSGIKDGLDTTMRIFPPLCAFVIGVGMLSASGFLDAAAEFCAPFFEKLGVPAELLPLVLCRPVSGSGAMAVLSDIFERYGADSLIGYIASIITGSSDTMVYVITIYLSSAGVQKSRHAFPAAALTMIFSLFLSCLLARAMF
jgi:spore maturation protein B